MQRNIIFIFSWLFYILILTGCDSGPHISPLDQESVVLAFGDSLTHGTGAPDGQSYPDVLSQLLNRPVINLGVPGEVTAAGLKRLPDVLNQYNPTLVILCLGGNDFLRRLDESETSRNLKAMIELIQQHGANLVLVAVPKLGFGLGIPKFYLEIAKQYSIPLQEDILLELLGDNSMKSDSIHPNATGYRLMAKAIHEVINEAQK